MKDIRAAIIKHKKTVCILGLIFVIFLECCVFPVGSITHSHVNNASIKYIVLAAEQT